MVPVPLIAGVLRRCANCCSRFRNKVAALFSPGTRPPPGGEDAATQLGREGEERAARFLRSAGYKVLYRNFRPLHGGEVDLVCRVRGTRELVFVEVKTRSSETYGTPAEAVDWEKQRRIVKAAEEWHALLEQERDRRSVHPKKGGEGVTIRFDVIELLHSGGHWEIRHWRSAFTGEETRHPGSAPTIPGANRGDVLPKRGHAGGVPSRPRRGRD